ncbi:hypothetical protein ma694 [Moumouvirus australiensis]|uniref:Uncharacterized protein n=1 Tax=Moumouvirus australiensis TaxID=2109587 RepID=A0A2P1EMH0_9VIRU|nr:hypothetical protein QKC55_gp210 [Moumouvirus australiensis]AVL95081.1 hypothetical protein ma694 [Moumouvirus australiensis]
MKETDSSSTESDIITDHNTDNTFQYYAKKIILDLIFKKLRDEEACCYGNFIRDMISGYEPTKLRTLFKSFQHSNIFLRTLKIYLDLKHLWDDKNTMAIKIKANKNNSYFMDYVIDNRYYQEIISLLSDDDSKKVLEKLSDSFKTISIKMIVKYETSIEYGRFEYYPIKGDLDVNTLMSNVILPDLIIGDLDTLNPNCNIYEIVTNIRKQQFTVISNSGYPIIDHSDIEFESDYLESHCIDYRSKRGKKILKTIRKMELRGWECINVPCKNEDCILSVLRRDN